MEQVRETVYGRQGTIENELSEQRQKLGDLESASFKHAQTVSETLENEIGRFEKVISAFEKYIETQTSDLRMVVQKQAEEDRTWRIEFEDG